MIAFGVLSIILGVIGMFVFWWLAIIGLVLGIIGICAHSKASKTTGIIGTCICGVDLLIMLIAVAMVA